MIFLDFLCDFLLNIDRLLALPMRACSCNIPIPEGIIDLNDPYYCSSNAELRPAYKMIDFELWTQSPAEFVSYVLKLYAVDKRKPIVGWFFFSYDTTSLVTA